MLKLNFLLLVDVVLYLIVKSSTKETLFLIIEFEKC